MKTILFMGDSITDAGRSREDDFNLGYGYATMTAGKLGCDYPGAFRFLNRGISGNRSIDLLARIKCDLLLSRVLKELPKLRIIVLEPFVLRAAKTEEQFDVFDAEVRLRAQVAKRLAEKHGLLFVPLQEMLSAFAAKTSAETVLADGVHPTYVGHELISRRLCDAFRTVFEAETLG